MYSTIPASPFSSCPGTCTRARWAPSPCSAPPKSFILTKQNNASNDAARTFRSTKAHACSPCDQKVDDSTGKVPLLDFRLLRAYREEPEGVDVAADASPEQPLLRLLGRDLSQDEVQAHRFPPLPSRRPRAELRGGNRCRKRVFRKLHRGGPIGGCAEPGRRRRARRARLDAGATMGACSAVGRPGDSGPRDGGAGFSGRCPAPTAGR